MKGILWILPFLFCFELGAQTPVRSFEIISTGAVQNVSPYINALEHTFLDRYRALDSRTVMRFHEGVVVQLLSAIEVDAIGLPVNKNVLNTIPTEGMEFTLLPPGRIVKWMPKAANPPTTNPQVVSPQNK